MGALIRFYFQQDPDEMDDDRFYLLWGDLMYALRWNQTIKLKDGETIEEAEEGDEDLEAQLLSTQISRQKGTYEFTSKKIIASGKKVKDK